MISLRTTDISRCLLEEIGLVNIRLSGKQTYKAVGKVVMILLGSGKPSKVFIEKILKIDENIPWKVFFKAIGWKTDSKVQANSLITTSALHKFLEAFQDTVDFEDYEKISPSCFFYLLENLLLWSSFTQEFLITTKSSLVEWRIGRDSNFSSTLSGHEMNILTDRIREVLVSIIKRVMFSWRMISEWIQKYGLNFSQYYPLLLLRMVVTLCLVCANCRRYLPILSSLLDKYEIISWLPRDFIDILKKKQGRNYVIMNANETINIIAEAFLRLGDPLVIVTASMNHYKYICPEAIIVDKNCALFKEDYLCKEDILKNLFSTKDGFFQAQDFEAEATKLCNNNNNGQSSKVSCSYFASTTSEKISENANQCKSGRIMFTSGNDSKSDWSLLRKHVLELKHIFQGFEAMDLDKLQALNSALDNGDLDMSCSIMYDTFLKQYALTGDPAIKAFLEEITTHAI